MDGVALVAIIVAVMVAIGFVVAGIQVWRGRGLRLILGDAFVADASGIPLRQRQLGHALCVMLLCAAYLSGVCGMFVISQVNGDASLDSTSRALFGAGAAVLASLIVFIFIKFGKNE